MNNLNKECGMKNKTPIIVGIVAIVVAVIVAIVVIIVVINGDIWTIEDSLGEDTLYKSVR